MVAEPPCLDDHDDPTPNLLEAVLASIIAATLVRHSNLRVELDGDPLCTSFDVTSASAPGTTFRVYVSTVPDLPIPLHSVA